MIDQAQSQNVETQVQELTLGELEHVRGGGSANFVLADGSVRNAPVANPQRYTDVPPS
ncbi:MAG: hypothetical protein Q8S13_09020 [Dehalococcoidia bacterium]|nr:hypothetical protein [Dehalococcoidia bacterium]